MRKEEEEGLPRANMQDLKTGQIEDMNDIVCNHIKVKARGGLPNGSSLVSPQRRTGNEGGICSPMCCSVIGRQAGTWWYVVGNLGKYFFLVWNSLSPYRVHTYLPTYLTLSIYSLILPPYQICWELECMRHQDWVQARRSGSSAIVSKPCVVLVGRSTMWSRPQAINKTYQTTTYEKQNNGSSCRPR